MYVYGVGGRCGRTANSRKDLYIPLAGEECRIASIRLGGWLDSINAERKDRSERRCIRFNLDAELLQFVFDDNREIVRVGTIIISHLLMFKCILHKTRSWVT